MYVTGSFEVEMMISFPSTANERDHKFGGNACPFRCSEQLHDSFANVSRTSPSLKLVSHPSYASTPGVRIYRKLVWNGWHVCLVFGQEVVHEPSAIEQCPLHTTRIPHDLAKRFARGGVEARKVRVGFDVSDPFGGNESFAVLGSYACVEEFAVDLDEVIAGEVDKGYQRCGIRAVQDR